MRSRILCLLSLVTIAVSSNTDRTKQSWGNAVPLLRSVVSGGVVALGNLANETDSLLESIQRSYDRIALFYKDNENQDKYIQSVVDFFVLRFMRYYSATKNDYVTVYARVLNDMRQFSELTAIELASPVRRHMDIIMGIISTPITLVQMHCQKNDTIECDQKYFSATFVESTKCRRITTHGAVFMKMRDFVVLHEQSYVALLKRVLKAAKALSAENPLFDAILMSLRTVQMDFQDILLFKSEIHGIVVKYQRSYKFKCFSVNRDPE